MVEILGLDWREGCEGMRHQRVRVDSIRAVELALMEFMAGLGLHVVLQWNQRSV